MGSFASTCCISQLPIEAGDDVRFFLLTKNPYGEGMISMHDLWFPRTYPLRAQYDDYGGVENVEEGPLRDIWLEAFQNDLIEVGVGDNSCHDVSALKDMSWEHFLDALQERRILVRDLDKGHAATEREGVPSLRSVMTRLESIGLKVSTCGWRAEGYHVDEEHLGSVRVRWAGSGDESIHKQACAKAMSALQGAYACMVTTGSGNYTTPAEVIARPFPGNRAPMDFGQKRLRVEQAMIREDVWQGLTGQPFSSWHEEKTYNAHDVLEAVQVAWTEAQAKVERIPELLDLGIPGLRSNHLARHIFDGPIPYVVNQAFHLRLILKRHPDVDLYAFQETVARWIVLERRLMPIGYYWRPTYPTGPQCGEWFEHRRFHRLMDRIAEENCKATEEE